MFTTELDEYFEAHGEEIKEQRRSILIFFKSRIGELQIFLTAYLRTKKTNSRINGHDNYKSRKN
jgi:hypothetical protein